ncbi:Aryldialkylphosphatase [Microbacterium sp. 8M]|uniref:phosphotriesterase family protein n=1 Tax=Microbacterium sp. 8M TaxID=2653153 RepID=UPI0012F1870D|nr:aryldialkylphosphatase [Microbacterium sp. 8M]VXB60330.1 Aryldialkylphosphatase [Microbacterium sp. 8M]
MSTGGVIRTVLGDVDAAGWGPTDYHEHLFQVTPLLPGDELDDERASTREAELLRDSGFAAMIDATPSGLGRDPAGVARIAEATGVRIVATAGRHREAHYEPGHPAHADDAATLKRRFIAEIAYGQPRDDADPDGPRALSPDGSPVRAGILKGGADYWRISAFERVTLLALAAAHRATGAAVMVHLEFCTAAHEVLDLLAAEGVASDRVVLAHADRDPDPGLHVALAQRGAYLGYDGFARPRTRSDAELLALTAAVVAAGAGDRVLLGGDVARRTRYIAYGGMPGLAYLGDRYLPRLRAEIGDAAVDTMLVANPARLLTLSR